MSLSRYWPSRDEINRCIKSEAESAPDAVLMAVHRPMPLLRRDEGSGPEEPATENDLLEAFLSDDLPQGTLLMPITGPSGAGKSHLIRWLAAQLGRDPRARHMHVIRIPKSASLRDVVEQVLEPLAGDARFAEVRENLRRAVAAVTPHEASIRFSAALEIALQELAERLIVALHANPPDTERRQLRTRADHARNLPGLFNDPALRRHMTEKVLTPIVQRAVYGRRGSDSEEDEALPQFRAEDLVVPDELRAALGHASMQVQRYYHTGLNRDDGSGRESAAAVLNEVVDRAIREVFQLEQATGGVTLESIILRIRQLFLEDERELVLLVEDFAALSGIQQVLLSVCIQEAERDGRRVRSRMRTALALTDGYLVGRDTIATRARHEWVIQGGSGPENVIDRTVELVGAYLNAARWGETELTRQFHESAPGPGQELTAWIGIFEDPERTPVAAGQLEAFGTSAGGIPLFPFNRAAVALLAERHLRKGGVLQFNPRKVINFLLRQVLLQRDTFEHGEFPPPEFERASPSAGIAAWLAAEAKSELERARLAAFTFYWGGNPKSPEEAGGIAPELFAAFGLQRPASLPEKPKTPEPQPPPRPRPPTPLPEPTPPRPPAADPQIVEWGQKLDRWASGEELAQRDANVLRNVLKRALEKAMPWNRLRMGKRNLNLLLTLPNARGNEAAATFRLAIATDHSDTSGQLRQTLLGAIRLDRCGGRGDYPEADEDSARLATLVERLVAELIPILEQERALEVKVLAWTLGRQARVLGLLPRQRLPRMDIQMRAVLAVGPAPGETTANPNASRWEQLRRDGAALRPELWDALLERIGCFQGDGRTPFAIDPTLIDLPNGEEPPDPGWLSPVQREHCRQLSPTRLPAVTRPLVEELRTFAARLDALLGPDRDKLALVSELNSLMQALEPVGVWPEGYTRSDFRRDIETLRTDNLMAQLEEAGPLLDASIEADLAADETLDRLGRLNFPIIRRSASLLTQVERFLAEAERAMAVKERELVGVDPDADAKELARLLDRIHRDLCTLAGEETP